jgi:hypothetical protein
VGVLALLAKMEVRATSQRVNAKLRKVAESGGKLGGMSTTSTVV